MLQKSQWKTNMKLELHWILDEANTNYSDEGTYNPEHTDISTEK